MMARVIAVANRKGGSGKTTVAVHIATGLAGSGVRVLLVDADPQGHATLWLAGGTIDPGARAESKILNEAGLYTLLTSQADPLSLIWSVERKSFHLDLLAGNANLVRYESERSSRRGEAHLMAHRLRSYHDRYDYIIIDTPPTMGLMMIAALMASQWVFIPLPMQFLALEGLEEMVRILTKINRTGNHNLRLRGIIPVFYDRRLRIAADIRRRVAAMLGRDIFLPPIRNSVKLAEAPGYGESVFDYAPETPVTTDWRAVVQVIQAMECRKHEGSDGSNLERVITDKDYQWRKVGNEFSHV